MADAFLGKIREAKENFREKDIKLGDNWSFSQYRTIKRIESYYNSQFETGEFDEDGWKKPFFNISRKPVQVAAKEIDLDTKDIILRTETGDYLAAEILADSLKQWMKDNGLNKKLNEIAESCPKYGSVVIKKVKDDYHLVDLKNLVIVDQSAKSLDHTSVIEMHLMTPDELMKRGYDADKTERAIELYASLGKPMIEVDEFYGWVKGDMIEGGDPTKLVYVHVVVAGAEEVEVATDKEMVIESGVVLSVEETKKHPYREWHWEKHPNRWLGVGFVEMAFDAQIRRNETAYYKAKGMQWTSLHLFQTDDENVARNLLMDVKNGDVIRTQTNRTITSVPVEERNLAHYGTEEVVWERNVAEMTFTPEVITGEGLPSGTPARSAIIADSNVKKYFDRKREDFGIFIRHLIETDILPMFAKKIGEGYVYSHTGTTEGREKLLQLIIDARMTKLFERFIVMTGKIPMPEEWNRVQQAEIQKITGQSSLDVKIPKGLFDKMKFKVDVVITKENEDTDAKIAGRQAVLAALSQNPTLVANPATRGIFLELAHLLGVKNLNVPPAVAQVQQPQQAPGGAPLGGQRPIPSGQPQPETGDVLSSVPLS